MTVLFKFRSSVDFDSVDIDGRPSISVRDLRSKIVEKKNLKICNDFDLIISDADAGTVYEDDDFHVPDGSSVIIKRVPSKRSAPSDLLYIDSDMGVVTKCVANFIDAVGSLPTAHVEVENFDDFGADLCPAPEVSLDSDLDTDNVNCYGGGRKDEPPLRCFDLPTKVPNNEPSDICEVMPGGIQKKQGAISYDAEGDILQAENTREQKKLNEEVDTSNPTSENMNLPTELRCSLCNLIFQEAVMIPCCQHSFCAKCIRSALVEREKCPKCSSMKCQVEDLLPNVSLRQAIERFLDSQALISGSDNLLKYAPDGESGIQAKEVSCAMSIHQREPLFPHSPSATGKGSNLVVTDSAWESHRNNGVTSGIASHIVHLNTNTSARSCPSSHKIKTVKGADGKDFIQCPAYVESAEERVEQLGDFQKEVTSTSTKRKGLWVNTSDGGGNFISNRFRKGDRTCYMCGSPDHFVRDCPAASSPHPMLPTGDTVFPGGNLTYAPPYWQATPLPHIRPYGNLYGTHGMMPFDTPMMPVTPFSVSSYMPAMYAGMPVTCGYMRMGGPVSPMVGGAERPLSHSEFIELKDRERRQKISNGLDRENTHVADEYSSEVHHYDELEKRLSDRKLHSSRKEVKNHYDVDDSWRLQKHQSCTRHSDSFSCQISNFDSDDDDAHSVGDKYAKDFHLSATGKDSKLRFSDKSNPERHLFDGTSAHHSRDRHRHYHKSSSKVDDERMERCNSGSTCKVYHHRNRKETSANRKRVEMDMKKHSRKHSCQTDVGLESSAYNDRKKQQRDKETSHSSRHSKHSLKAVDDDGSKLDRWEMVDGLDQDGYEDLSHHKRKRYH